MHHQIHAEGEGALHQGRRERRVDQGNGSRRLRRARHRSDVEDAQGRVGGRFEEAELRAAPGAGVHQSFRLGHAGLHAEPAKDVAQELVGAAIQCRCGHDLFTAGHERHHGGGHGAHAAAEQHTGVRTLQRRQRRLGCAHGGILVAAVHVKAAFAARVPLHRLGALEPEGGRLDDGGGDRRVRSFGRAGVHRQGGDLHAARSIAGHDAVQAARGEEKAPGANIRGLRKLKRAVPGWRGTPFPRRRTLPPGVEQHPCHGGLC